MMSTNKKQRFNDTGVSSYHYDNNSAATATATAEEGSGLLNALSFSPPPSPPQMADKRKAEVAFAAAAVAEDDEDGVQKLKSYNAILLHEIGCLKKELGETKALLAEANNKLSAEASDDDDDGEDDDEKEDLNDPWTVKFIQYRQFQNQNGHTKISGGR